MTRDEFFANFPFEKRGECLAYMKDKSINGLVESATFEDETPRFRVKVVIAKAMKVNPKTGKRTTATALCRTLYLSLQRKADGEPVERADFIAAAAKKGIHRGTAGTQFWRLHQELGEGGE